MAQHLILAAVLAAVALLASSAAGQGYPWLACDSTAGNFTPSSRYFANINIIGAALPKNASASPDLFATVVVGAIPDKVWALALCRGDANATYCLSCLAHAFRDLANLCAYNKDAAIYYDKCMFGYSSSGFPAAVDDSGTTYESPNYEDITLEESPRFNRFRAVLMNATADYAAYKSTRRYAAGEADMDLPDYTKLYSWAQCTPTPDLTPARCRRCLAGVISQLYTNSSVGMVLGVRCSIRHQTDSFMDGPVMVLRRQALAPSPKSAALASTPNSAGALAPTPAPVAATGGAVKKRSEPGILAGVACSVVLVLILSVFVFVRRRRRPNKPAEKDHPLMKITRAQCMIFDLPALQEATENFLENNKLGQGGFGAVYRGILPDGQEIAVKKLLGRTGHGLHQLHNEVLVLAELQHKNLVRLQGFCSHREETLLVYEYIKNGSLDNFLFHDSREIALNWEQRFNIILGIAKGILYLHEDSKMRIIHRDLKANNILLDQDMDPKIADFGLARLLGEDHSQTKTSKVVGTLGYMAPEYVIDGSVSTMIDIFSFGVLVLEIVTGRNNSSSEDHDAVNLLSHVWNCWTEGTVSQMVDQSLDGYFLRQALRCIHIGLLCVQPDPDDRPRISSVVFMLTRGNIELPPPAQPAFYFGRESNLPSPLCGQRSYAYDRPSIRDISVNEVTLTQPYPR